MRYWIGQTFGIIATIAGISIPVFKKKWQMLIMNIANNTFCALNLVFLDRIGSGIFLFIVAAAQAVVNLVHTLRGGKPKSFEKLIFLALYLGLGFYGLITGPGYVPGINAHNLLELMPIIGALLSMCFISARNETLARILFICCNSVWAVYFIIIWSASFFGSFFSILSGLAALYKNRSKKTAA